MAIEHDASDSTNLGFRRMKRERLAAWTSIAEIVASVGVVISMLFLAYSVRENTAAVEAAEERAFLDAWREIAEVPFYTNAELAGIQLKVYSGEPLTALEAQRWWNYLRAVFDAWWQFYNAYADGLVSEAAFEEMDRSVFSVWEREAMGKFWSETRRYYANAAFARHIDSKLEDRARARGSDDR